MKHKLSTRAIEYAETDLSVIPLLPKEKTPLIKWKKYQTVKASIQEVKDWWECWPNANIGIVTGRISGIVVVDVDIPDKKSDILILASTELVAMTGSGGYHLFYQYPANFDHIPNSVRIAAGIDIRADGGYIVAPGSVHPNGRMYEWI